MTDPAPFPRALNIWRDDGSDTPAIDEEGLALLLDWATRDTRAFERLTHLAADMLRSGDPLPRVLATFAANVLTGALGRPRQHGRHVEDLLERDLEIHRQVNHVARVSGLPHTRNRVTPPRTDDGGFASACDVVATMQTPNLTYENVERIWLEHGGMGSRGGSRN